jgi:hypothetical protein
MERVIDIVSGSPGCKEELTVSKHRLHLSPTRPLLRSMPSCELVSMILESELTTVKDSLPESLLPLVPIEKLPLDATIHPHVVSRTIDKAHAR